MYRFANRIVYWFAVLIFLLMVFVSTFLYFSLFFEKSPEIFGIVIQNSDILYAMSVVIGIIAAILIIVYLLQFMKIY